MLLTAVAPRRSLCGGQSAPVLEQGGTPRGLEPSLCFGAFLEQRLVLGSPGPAQQSPCCCASLRQHGLQSRGRQQSLHTWPPCWLGAHKNVLAAITQTSAGAGCPQSLSFVLSWTIKMNVRKIMSTNWSLLPLLKTLQAIPTHVRFCTTIQSTPEMFKMIACYFNVTFF